MRRATAFLLPAPSCRPVAGCRETLVPLDQLCALAHSNAERIERVIATQFIHRGSDHRAHIGSILGAHGVEGPDLDASAFGRAIGVPTAPLR